MAQSTGPDLQFEYNPTGHRIEKRIKNGTLETRWDRYYYLRDPQGNVMAVYSYKYEDLGGDHYRRSLTLDEQHIYGSSRHAVSKPQATLYKECFELTSPTFDSEGFLTGGSMLEIPGAEDNTGSSYNYTITRGRKYYEISNHLGNVMSTLRDRKLPQESSGDIINFTPDVSSWQDYLPFGMLMYHRNGDDGEVGRYGFQAQERDDELKGAGNSIDYKFRMHDTRLGRFFAVDPLVSKYPFWSPYQFAGNMVIQFIELEGLEPWESRNSKVSVMSISDYSNQLEKNIIPLARVSHKELLFDCNDFALFLVMKYFEYREVEFSISINNKEFNSSDKSYNDFNSFFEDIRLEMSSNKALNQFTTSLTPDQARTGDLYISQSHTYVLEGLINESNKFDVVYTSGLYYGKHSPETKYESSLSFNTLTYDANSKNYSLKRWNFIADLELESKVEISRTPIKEIEVIEKPMSINKESNE